MDHAHPLVCISTRKLATETRHDCVLDALVKVARDLGVPVQREYRSWINGKAQRRLRPDLLFDGAGLSILSDVAMTTPTTATAMKNGSTTTPLTAASLMETYKHNKYDKLAAEQRLKLVPFVLESYGGWGKAAHELIKQLAQVGVALTGGGTLTEREAITTAIRTLSIALVQGNARTISFSNQLSRARKVPVVHLEQQPNPLPPASAAHSRPPALPLPLNAHSLSSNAMKQPATQPVAAQSQRLLTGRSGLADGPMSCVSNHRTCPSLYMCSISSRLSRRPAISLSDCIAPDRLIYFLML